MHNDRISVNMGSSSGGKIPAMSGGGGGGGVEEIEPPVGLPQFPPQLPLVDIPRPVGDPIQNTRYTTMRKPPQIRRLEGDAKSNTPTIVRTRVTFLDPPRDAPCVVRIAEPLISRRPLVAVGNPIGQCPIGGADPKRLFVGARRLAVAYP